MEEGIYLVQTPDKREVLVSFERGGFYPLVRQNKFDPSTADGVGEHPALCSCTGATPETATPLVASKTAAVCPLCGKRVPFLKTPADYRAEREEERRKAREDLRLIPAGRTADFGMAYCLSTRISNEEWRKVSEYMRYITTRDEAGMDADDYDFGWVTFQPGLVEEALGITGKKCIGWREPQDNLVSKRKREILQRVGEIAHMIWTVGEMPEGTNSPVGDRLFDSQDVHGGGDWFVVGPEHIWHIKNNGMDGDDWTLNNVRTGGAGAIGRRVPADPELTDELQKLAKEFAEISVTIR